MGVDHLRSYGHIGIDEWVAHLQDAVKRAGADMIIEGNAARGKTAVSGMVYTLDLESYRSDSIHGVMRPYARVGGSAAMATNAGHALVDCEERGEALRKLLRVEALLCGLTVWLKQVRCNVCLGKKVNGWKRPCEHCEGRGWEREVQEL